MFQKINEFYRKDLDVYLFEDTETGEYEVEVFTDELGTGEDDLLMSYSVLIYREIFQSHKEALKVIAKHLELEVEL